MKVLISERLSEHKYKTPEGYLICTDAILARTGKQRYTKDELFGDGDSEEVDVDRPYEQVMNEKTISSFENKPVTFDHPDEDVNVGNYKEYAVGYVRDVHQGKVDGRDVILGNLVITDQDAIDAIENGEHTDLSCGYDCDIKDDGHGSYYQNNIRGNHVALCREGRAGNARIVDSKIKDDTRTYYSTIRNQKFKIKGLPNHRIKMIYEDGKEEEKKESYFKELLQKQIIRIVDSKINDISWSWDDLETFIFKNYKDGPVHSEVDEDVLDGFSNRLDATKLADFLEKRAHVNRADIVRTRFGYGIKVYGVHDSKLNDAAIGGHYKNNRGENFFICSYGSGFSIFKADGEYLDGSRHLSLDGVKQRILSYNLTKVKDSVGASKARDSKIEGVAPELLLSASEWLEDKIYIERKYHVKIYNITSNKGLTVTGSRQDLEKLYKDYHLKDYYGLKIVDSKLNDADKYSYRLTKTKNDYDEYVIKAYKNGKYYEDASYYTDDWQDALDTLKMMAKREGLNFRQEGSRYVADSIYDSNIVDALSASEKDLCDYMLENCREEDEDENDLLKKMKLYYSEYSSLARKKPNEVLDYFREHIDNFEDSIKDSSNLSASKALKLTKIVSMLHKK